MTTLEDIVRHRLFKPGCGAALAVLCGIALWKMPLGEPLVNASYDCAFRFGARAVTNKVVLILMDNDAHDKLGQVRGQPWNRTNHTRLLNKLIADRCPLVIFDVFFKAASETNADQALAAAMQQHGNVALMTEQAEVTRPGLRGVAQTNPLELFLKASRTNGVAWFKADEDSIVRRHWPFPAPGSEPYRSLAWVAADLAGAQLPVAPQEQWLRFYGEKDRAPWTRLGYHYAEKQGTNYFHDKIVFIGNWPKTSIPGLSLIHI